MRILLQVLLIGGVCCAGVFVQAEDPEPIRFDRDIRPILSNHCFHCHGPDHESREAELRLDTREGLFAGLSEGRHLIAPGKARQSELFQRVSTDDSSLRMPPVDGGKPLTKAQIDLLERWIDSGARWSGHWAYEPIVRPQVPQVHDPEWGAHPIDRFVMHKLESAGVQPVAKADQITLIRRLSLDLNGMLPERKLVAEFSQSAQPVDYDRLVTTFLDSPRFGERMAVYWLDLVRYADSCGYHGDVDQSVAPYRDYVIHSFNKNLPFDQFTREQLAGDLLPNPTIDQQVATCFNRLNKVTEEGGAQEGEYLAKSFADRVRTVSITWLGATFGCAECHDHKFDPITTEDFYRFGAFFADVTEKGVYKPLRDHSPVLDLPTPQQSVERDRLHQELARLRAELQKLPADNAESTAKDPLKPAGDRASETVTDPVPVSPHPVNPRRAELVQEIEQAEKQVEHLQSQIPRVLVTIATSPREIRILPRGDWLNSSGPVVQPAIPQKFRHGALPSERLTRLDLANWLVDRSNPLTARVFVNRIWKLLFGNGLSRNLEDLGFQGEAPTHPELLDWLAAEFIESGWDVKHLFRLIVSSRAYQLSSIPADGLPERDPQNRLLSHQSRWRIEAEFLRDNALSVSGLLDSTLGGPSVKPYQPAGYWEFLNFPPREWQASVGPAQYRRGLYTHWQRTFLHPSLLAFDASSREECTANRPTSNTPKAALALLNDPTFVECARVLAARVLHEGGLSDEERLHWVWELALSRPPDPAELLVLEKLLSESRLQFQTHEAAALQLLGVGQAAAAADLPVTEVASWTSVCRAILNLHEFTTRN